MSAGDLIVAGTKPGWAMPCPDPAQCVGSVVGRALSSRESGGQVTMFVQF